MRLILKKSIFLSIIAGLAAGVVLLVPFLTPLVFLLLFVAIGAGVIVYIKKNNIAGILSIQDGAFIGAITGFASLTAASVVYLPLIYLFNLIFGNQATKLGMGNSLINLTYNLFIVIMLVFFTALLSAIFNAFTGMIAAYIYEKIEDRPFDFNTQLEIEQDD